MEFMFDEKNPLIDESWDLEGELFELVENMTDAEKQLLLDAGELPNCIYEAIAKSTLKTAA